MKDVTLADVDWTTVTPESCAAADAARTAERDAAKAERKAERDARKAERQAQRDAKVHGKSGAHAGGH